MRYNFFLLKSSSIIYMTVSLIVQFFISFNINKCESNKIRNKHLECCTNSGEFHWNNEDGQWHARNICMNFMSRKASLDMPAACGNWHKITVNQAWLWIDLWKKKKVLIRCGLNSDDIERSLQKRIIAKIMVSA